MQHKRRCTSCKCILKQANQNDIGKVRKQMYKRVIKFLTVILCISVCFSACNQSEEKVENTQASTAEQTEAPESHTNATVDNQTESNDSNTEPDENATILESNGFLKEGFEGHDRSELNEVTEVVFKAFQELDMDTLKIYLRDKDFEEASRCLTPVKEDSENYEIWKNTVGQMIYLPESDVLLVKSTHWVENAWYTDCWRNNSEIPADSAEELSRDYLMKIYEKYYVNAPYKIIADFSSVLYFSVEDGYVKCEIYDILPQTAHGNLSDLLATYETGHLYSALILNNTPEIGLGYDYIVSEDKSTKIPEYEDLMEGDLSKVIEIADKYSLKNTTIDKYLRNDETRKILQQYLNENCEILRDVSTVNFFCKSNSATDLGYRKMTPNDIEYINSLGIKCVFEWTIFSLPDNWTDPYHQLLMSAVHEDLIKLER